MAGGRFNNPTEAGYAPVEGELLGIASALHKSRYFISGHPKVTIITDHKPLLSVLGDRMSTINNKWLTNWRYFIITANANIHKYITTWGS